MQKFNERKDSKKQLYWKKRLWYSCFLMNLARYLRQLFYRTPPGNCFCSTEKYFTNKIVESLLKKRKNIGNYWQVKQRHTQKKDVSLLVSSFISFHYSKISLFLFSASHDTLKARVFTNNAITLRIYLL